MRRLHTYVTRAANAGRPRNIFRINHVALCTNGFYTTLYIFKSGYESGAYLCYSGQVYILGSEAFIEENYIFAHDTILKTYRDYTVAYANGTFACYNI